jgi:hypothetical protein
MEKLTMNHLYLDIETRADKAAIEAASAAKHEELEAITAPANYRDSPKIAQYRQDKQAAIIARLRKEAALSPFTAYISSIALRLGERARPQVHILVLQPASLADKQNEARPTMTSICTPIRSATRVSAAPWR